MNRRNDVYYARESSSASVHKMAVERMRQFHFTTLHSIVLDVLSKELNIKRSKLNRSYIVIHYREDKNSPRKYKHSVAANDGSFGFGGCYGFWCNSPTGPVKEVRTIEIPYLEVVNLASHMPEIHEFLTNEENLLMEGVFVKSNTRNIRDIIERLVSKNPIDFAKEGFDAHDCANVLKLYLHQMTDPIFPSVYYAAYRRISELAQSCKQIEEARINYQAGIKTNRRLLMPDSDLRHKELTILNSIQLILQLMTQKKREFFETLIDILGKIYENRASNHSSSSTLGAIFAPLLVCPRSLPQPVAESVSKDMSHMISKTIEMAKDIFDIPLNLQIAVWEAIRKKGDLKGGK